MSSPTSPRKRCELACRPCRHRKIKCQTTQVGGACDNCRAKGKERECEFIPVAEDFPPPKPRQSPPAREHSYAPLTPITITTGIEHGSMSPNGASSSYYGVYSQYNTAQPSPHYHTSVSPTQATFQHEYQYAQSSTPQHYQPASPSSGYNDCPTGMTIPAGGVEMAPLQQPTWDSQQARYVVDSYLPVSNAWSSTPAVLSPQLNQTEMPFYTVDQAPAYGHQQPNQHYNGPYYNSP